MSWTRRELKPSDRLVELEEEVARLQEQLREEREAMEHVLERGKRMRHAYIEVCHQRDELQRQLQETREHGSDILDDLNRHIAELEDRQPLPERAKVKTLREQKRMLSVALEEIASNSEDDKSRIRATKVLRAAARM